MNIKKTIKDLSKDERPYEKFMKFGAEALTDAELLSIIIRSGIRGVSSLEISKSLLSSDKVENGINSLFHLSTSELEQIPGVGKVKAIQLKCLCEISKRIARSSALKKLDFGSPSSIAQYYMEALRHEEQENVYCMMLDTKNTFIGDICLTKGTVNSSLVSPRELFIMAVSFHAVKIVLIHNHPSGDPSPSSDDILITQRVYDAGEILGIKLLDHIIIGSNCYSSIIAESCLIKT